MSPRFTRTIGWRKAFLLKHLVAWPAGVWLVGAASLGGCASAPVEGEGSDAGASGARAAGGGGAEGAEEDSTPSAGTASLAPDRTYPGFLTEAFPTEPLAILPVARVDLPRELVGGAGGGDLKREIEGLLLDRLPAEIRIVHTLAPVYGFRDWARGPDVSPGSGHLATILAWREAPGPDGAIPEAVGNSVETLGDNRGIRYFLLPRSLSVIRYERLRYFATLEAYLLDARGERAVWSGSGRAWGALPGGDLAEQILIGVVRDAVRAAGADLATRLPSAGRAAPRKGFSDTNR